MLFRSLVYVEAAAVMQGSSLAENARESEKKDEWVSCECCEDRMRLEWGSLLRSQGCREFEGACRSVYVNSDMWQCYARVALGKGCANRDGVCAKAVIER